MDDGLKQRIVGAVVLVALAVLFVPVLFEPEFNRELDRTTQVPPAPGILPLRVADPVRPESIEPAKPAKAMYQLLPEPAADGEMARQSSKAASEIAGAKPALVKKPSVEQRRLLDPKGVPKAWAVQVASFHTEKRAKVLRDQLLEDSYPAFTRTLETSKGKVTRVYVGPKVERRKAASIKRELDKSLKINSLLVRFSP